MTLPRALIYLTHANILNVPLDRQIVDAWLEAAADLGIRVIAPFLFSTENGEAVLCEAHLPDFGGSNGILVGNCDSNQLVGLRLPDGYGYSHLGDSYRTYS